MVHGEPTVVDLHLDQQALDALGELIEPRLPNLSAVVQYLACSAGAYTHASHGNVEAAHCLASQSRRKAR